MTAYNGNLGLTGSTIGGGKNENIYKYQESVTAGSLSNKSGPAKGKKYPGQTMWYNNKLVNMQ